MIFAVSSIDSGAAGMAMGVAGICQLRCEDSAGACVGLALAPRGHAVPRLTPFNSSFREARRPNRRVFFLRIRIAALINTTEHPHTEAKA